MVTEWWRAGRSVTVALWLSVQTSAVFPLETPWVVSPALSPHQPPVLRQKDCVVTPPVSMSAPASPAPQPQSVSWELTVLAGLPSVPSLPAGLMELSVREPAGGVKEVSAEPVSARHTDLASPAAPAS